MAEPSFDTWVKALRDQGLTVVVIPGASGRCRCHNGPHYTDRTKVRKWEGTPRGLAVHCTYGGKKRGSLPGLPAYEYSYGLLGRIGNGSTPGPLCWTSVDMDGVVYVVSSGRANHLGYIGADANKNIRAASWDYNDNYDDERGATYDGNAITYGIEVMANGDMNADQYESVLRICIAFCKVTGRPGSAIFGHGEAASARAYDDPNLDMGKVRRTVRDRLAAKPATTKPSPLPQAGATTTKEEIPMDQTQFNKLMNGWATSPDGKRNLAVAAMSATYGDHNNDKTGDTAGQIISLTSLRVRDLQAQVAGLTKALDQLALGQGLDPQAITKAVHAAFDGVELRGTLGTNAATDGDAR